MVMGYSVPDIGTVMTSELNFLLYHRMFHKSTANFNNTISE